MRGALANVSPSARRGLWIKCEVRIEIHVGKLVLTVVIKTRMRRFLFCILLTVALNSNAQDRRPAVLEALEAEVAAYTRLEYLYGLDVVRESSPWFSVFTLRDRIDGIRRDDERTWDRLETELHFRRRPDDWQGIETRLRRDLREEPTWQRRDAVIAVEAARRAWERADGYRSTGD